MCQRNIHPKTLVKKIILLTPLIAMQVDYGCVVHVCVCVCTCVYTLYVRICRYVHLCVFVCVCACCMYVCIPCHLYVTLTHMLLFLHTYVSYQRLLVACPLMLFDFTQSYQPHRPLVKMRRLLKVTNTHACNECRYIVNMLCIAQDSLKIIWISNSKTPTWKQ